MDKYGERWPWARNIIAAMSDQKLRELERRWGETGSVEDEATYLRELVRAGHLAQGRLQLAANCGCVAARMATLSETSGSEPVSSYQDLQALVRTLTAFGSDAVAVSCLAIHELTIAKEDFDVRESAARFYLANLKRLRGMIARGNIAEITSFLEGVWGPLEGILDYVTSRAAVLGFPEGVIRDAITRAVVQWALPSGRS